jgi:hypothetical protein
MRRRRRRWKIGILFLVRGIMLLDMSRRGRRLQQLRMRKGGFAQPTWVWIEIPKEKNERIGLNEKKTGNNIKIQIRIGYSTAPYVRIGDNYQYLVHTIQRLCPTCYNAYMTSRRRSTLSD